jgi:ABC-type lipoprotein export system ATPase subunit
MAMSFRVEQLTFHYPGAAGPALAGLDFDLRDRAGQAVALLGPSGSGKTTLLNLLGLLWEQPPGQGRVVYRGTAGDVDYRDLSRAQGNELRLREFGFVLQSCYLLPHFSCVQNIALPLALQGWREADRLARVEALLREVEPAGGDDEAGQELWQVRHRLGSEVSLGQRQRLAALRAVVHDPQVIFADEPVSNLDAGSTRRMLGLLRDWRQGRWALPGRGGPGRTLFLVCHHLETALREADWLLVLGPDHRLAASFGRTDWPLWQARVRGLLGAELFPGPGAVNADESSLAYPV